MMIKIRVSQHKQMTASKLKMEYKNTTTTTTTTNNNNNNNNNNNKVSYVQVNYQQNNSGQQHLQRRPYHQASRANRGSLSSCSSSSSGDLSSNEMDPAESPPATFDCCFSYEDAATTTLQVDRHQLRRKRPVQPKNRAHKPGNLHGRSISLIINPNFASRDPTLDYSDDDDDAFEAPKQQPEPVRPKQSHRPGMNEPTDDKLEATKGETNQNESHQLIGEGKGNTDIISTELHCQQDDESTSIERFRHLGLLLRLISDQFARRFLEVSG